MSDNRANTSWWTELWHSYDLYTADQQTASQNLATTTVAATETGNTQYTVDAEVRMNEDNNELREKEIDAELAQANLAHQDNQQDMANQLLIAREKNETDLKIATMVDAVTAKATLVKAQSLCLAQLGDMLGDMGKWDKNVGKFGEGYYGLESQKTYLSDFFVQFSDKFGTAFEDLTNNTNSVTA